MEGNEHTDRLRYHCNHHQLYISKDSSLINNINNNPLT